MNGLFTDLMDRDGRYRRRLGRMRNTGAPGGGDQGGPSGTGDGSAAASSTATTDTGTQQPVQTGADQGGQQATADDIPNGNWKVLRERYDASKGRVTELESQVGKWGAISSEATTLAGKLGISDTELAEAFDKDPIATLMVLRQEAAAAAGQQKTGDQQPDIKSMIGKELDPIKAHINQQVTEATLTRYTAEVTRSISADPILKDAPAEVQDLVKDYLNDFLAKDPDVLAGWKQGKAMPQVEETVKFVAGRLNDAFSKWQTHRSTPTGQRNAARSTTTGQGVQQGGKKLTLDDMINDPGVLGDKYR